MSPPDMDISLSESRYTNLDMQVPVTTHDGTGDRSHHLLPEAHRLEFSALEPRYTERSSLPLMLPSRIQSSAPDIRFTDRIPEPRFSDPRSLNPTSLSVPFPSSVPLTAPGNSGNTYQMLSSDLFNSMGPQSTFSSSFTIPSSPQLPAGLMSGYLSGAPIQNLQSSIYPTGEVRTYEILGQKQDMMGQRAMDIQLRQERGLVSPTLRLLDNSHIQSRDNEREMQTNQSPHSDSSVVVGHSPPRHGRNNVDANVWRPY